MSELLKILDVRDTVVVEINYRMTFFAAGPITIIYTLIDKSYPNHRRAILLGFDRILRGCPKELRGALEHLEIITTEREDWVTLSIGKDVISIAMRSPDAGEHSNHLKALTSEGELIVFGLNSKHDTGVLSAIAGDENNLQCPIRVRR